MKKFLTKSLHSQRGFTLIELLIVVAILGIIAAVAVPNVGSFMISGTLNAANTEAQNVKTAAVAYYAEKSPPAWPDNSGELTPYITGTIKATYTFHTDGARAGLILSADPTSGWGTDIEWDEPTQTWVRVTP